MVSDVSTDVPLPFDANNIPLFRQIKYDISNRDEMFAISKATFPAPAGAAFHYYFFSGGFIAHTLKYYFETKKVDPLKLSILEFAAGHGRITRYLPLIFGDVTCSDLEQDMIDFQRNSFNIKGFMSDMNPDSITWPVTKFDVVFSFSLFTHLHPDVWDAWFWTLFSRVAEGGYFIMSTLPPSVARLRGHQLRHDSLLTFAPRNETGGRLDPSVYGRTTTDIRYLLKLLGDRTDVEYTDHFSGGIFDLYQDIHIFRRVEATGGPA